MDLSHYVKRVKFNLVDLNIVQYGEIHCFEFRTSYCEKRKRHLTAYIYEFGQYQLVYSFDIYNPLQKATCEFYFDEHVIYKKLFTIPISFQKIFIVILRFFKNT